MHKSQKPINTLASASLFALTLLASGCAVAMVPTAPETTLPTGVKITLTTPGMKGGAKPTSSSVVKVHYRGTLENGKEFDSSYARGMPATFPLDRVIPCWTQAVQQLVVGSRAVIICPGSTAYGPQGIPGTIPPNATLRFEIELIAIEK